MEGQDTAFIKYKMCLPTKWDKPFTSEEITQLKIYANDNNYFEARNLNVFTNYVISFTNVDLIKKMASQM